jgi:hypothetical protein
VVLNLLLRDDGEGLPVPSLAEGGRVAALVHVEADGVELGDGAVEAGLFEGKEERESEPMKWGKKRNMRKRTLK